MPNAKVAVGFGNRLSATSKAGGSYWNRLIGPPLKRCPVTVFHQSNRHGRTRCNHHCRRTFQPAVAQPHAVDCSRRIASDNVDPGFSFDYDSRAHRRFTRAIDEWASANLRQGTGRLLPKPF